MLSTATVEELQKILKEEFGIKTTIAEASGIATSLVQYVEALVEINNESGKSHA